MREISNALILSGIVLVLCAISMSLSKIADALQILAGVSK